MVPVRAKLILFRTSASDKTGELSAWKSWKLQSIVIDLPVKENPEWDPISNIC